jgi:hypothetical protein
LKAIRPSELVGYTISGIVGIFGILVLTEGVANEGMPSNVRIAFGVVLVLFGIYRFAMTRLRATQAERKDQ